MALTRAKREWLPGRLRGACPAPVWPLTCQNAPAHPPHPRRPGVNQKQNSWLHTYSRRPPRSSPRGSDVGSSRLGYLLAPIISLTFLVSGFFSRDSRGG